ncbi:hypothetical protein C8Q80DRAFT_1119839 [Daedaleopsis nitida]|nr:hypothetical protein C8Q80DRAFT_1119839 [Daedaleopsis nitida]
MFRGGKSTQSAAYYTAPRTAHDSNVHAQPGDFTPFPKDPDCGVAGYTSYSKVHELLSRPTSPDDDRSSSYGCSCRKASHENWKGYPRREVPCTRRTSQPYTTAVTLDLASYSDDPDLKIFQRVARIYRPAAAQPPLLGLAYMTSGFAVDGFVSSTDPEIPLSTLSGTFGERGQDAVGLNQERLNALAELAKQTFVYLVADVGFFTDGYIFAINIATTMLGYAYGTMPAESRGTSRYLMGRLADNDCL